MTIGTSMEKLHILPILHSNGFVTLTFLAKYFLSSRDKFQKYLPSMDARIPTMSSDARATITSWKENQNVQLNSAKLT